MPGKSGAGGIRESDGRYGQSDPGAAADVVDVFYRRFDGCRGADWECECYVCCFVRDNELLNEKAALEQWARHLETKVIVSRQCDFPDGSMSSGYCTRSMQPKGTSTASRSFSDRQPPEHCPSAQYCSSFGSYPECCCPSAPRCLSFVLQAAACLWSSGGLQQR